MASKSTRSLLLILMDALFVVAVLDAARLVVRFFGELADAPVGEKFVELSAYIVVPLGIDTTTTSYGGVFDWDATVTVAALLVIEAILGIIRKRS